MNEKLETPDRPAEYAAQLMQSVAAREVIPQDPRRSFRAFVHDYPTALARWHYHPELEIHLIRESSGTIIAGDFVGHFSAGQVTLIGAGLPHNWISDLGPGDVVKDRDYVIQFDVEWLRGCQESIPELVELEDLVLRSARGLVFSGVAAVEAAEAIRAVVAADGANRIAPMFRLLMILSDAPRTEQEPLAGEWFAMPSDRNAKTAAEAGVAYILDNLDGDIRLSTAADLAHMSASSFSRYFRQASGLTFSVMVRKLRIARACRLLETTDMSIGTVCAASGYNNLANFNRQFLATLGMTPSRYRRQGESPMSDSASTTAVDLSPAAGGLR